jgi:hypothetical protein
MMLLANLLLTSLALAEDPVCTLDLAPAPSHLSVAWISSLGERVGANGWLTVVPTASLKEYVSQDQPGVGRLLQHLGERRRSSDPRRRYKITIFDVDSSKLCRPIEGVEDGALVSGTPACLAAHARVNGAYAGCGQLVDRGTGELSLPVYRLTWGNAAFAGFCVLPVERFLGNP